jgi:hypothetical protein
MLSSSEQMLQLLKANGWERFLKKCNRYNAELMFSGFDQLLYTGIMEAMGYDKNKFNTLAIAQHFTLERLQQWKQNGLDALTLASIWLNYAGLKDKAKTLLDPEYAARLNQAFEYQTFTIEKANLNWNLFRIRPANHPVKRIIQAAYIIHSLLDRGLLNSLINVFKDSNFDKPTALLTELKKHFQPVSEAWDYVEKPGTTLITTITGNIILPIIYLYAGKTNDVELQNKIKALYEKFPNQGENYITNFMQGYMNDEQWGFATANYVNQQGLLNIYYRFCKYRLCELCLKEKQKCLLSL